MASMFGSAGTIYFLMVILLILALVLSIITAMAGSSRTLYQGSVDGWLPKYLSYVNEHGAPTRAMWTDLCFNLILLMMSNYLFVLAVSNCLYIIFNFINLHTANPINLGFFLFDELIKLRNLHRVSPLLVFTPVEDVHVILRPIAVEKKHVLLPDQLPQIFQPLIAERPGLAIDSAPIQHRQSQLIANDLFRHPIPHRIQMNSVIRVMLPQCAALPGAKIFEEIHEQCPALLSDARNRFDASAAAWCE